MDLSGSQAKKSVPKFASFKPPPAPPQADRATDRPSREHTRRDEKSRHRSHRSHRDRSQSRDRRRERRDHRHSRKEDVRHEPAIAPEPIVVSEAVVKPTDGDGGDLYVVDRKGDKYNLIYGTLHRYSIPTYHRVGGGRVLGLPRSCRIDRNTAEGEGLVIRKDTWSTDATRTKSKNMLSKLNRQKPRLLRLREESIADAITDITEDFLSLDPFRNQKHREVFGEPDSDDEKHAYRSIRGKAKPEDHLPSHMEFASETESSGEEGQREDLSDEIKQLNVDLSRNVEQNPNDVGAWLQLIDHQDSLLRGTDENRPLTYAERTSLADIKISLCEKALKRIGQSTSQDLLLLRLLEEGAKLWDTKKLSAQWESILRSNSQFLSLWVKYLDFRQTEFLDFTYERCMATFIDCLRLNLSSPDRPEKVHVQNYLLLRLTLFIREAGFTEHAVGLWQAIFESTVFRPEELNLNYGEGMMPTFIQFWESETARIGDFGAKGWKSRSSLPMEPKASSFQSHLNPNLIFPSWAVCERDRTFNARTPARSLDESEDDDPYRVIISSDFEELLPLIWNLNSTDSLVDGFLYFCHLPPVVSPANIETTSRWSGDNFVRNEFMGNPDQAIDMWLSKSETGDRPMPFSFPYHNFIHTADSFFAQPQTWFSSFRRWMESSSSESGIDADWTRRSLRLLVEANPEDDNLAEYVLGLEFACNSKEAKKFAKSLLKKRSSCLRLYNCYALMERRSGNNTAADHVWATSISMGKTFSEHARVDAALLWRAWIWESLESRDIARAASLLLAMPQHSIDIDSLPTSSQATFGATELLKIRNFLSSSQGSALGAEKANVFMAYTDCLAILAYLSHSLDLSQALETYGIGLNMLSTSPMLTQAFKAFTIQLLHQTRAKLLHYHMRTSNLYKPAQVRSVLGESIAFFPHNTIFLSLFSWNESRFRIEERVRDVMRDITRATQPTDSHTSRAVPITTHLFSIYTELNRPVYAGSTLHSTRAAFEKAIGDVNTRANAWSSDASTARTNLTIWKLYILFEVSHNEIQRAKDAFYRGMRACPWSKQLIMLAFTHLRADLHVGGMGFEELRRVYNVLVEKELRVHVEIEDLLEQISTKNMQTTTDSLGLPFQLPNDPDGDDL